MILPSLNKAGTPDSYATPDRKPERKLRVVDPPAMRTAGIR